VGKNDKFLPQIDDRKEVWSFGVVSMGRENKQHISMRFICRPIIFYHSGRLDQPGVAEKPSEYVEQQQLPTRLAAERCHLERVVHRDLGKNTHLVTSCGDCTCCRVVAVDGVAAAVDQGDDMILVNTVG